MRNHNRGLPRVGPDMSETMLAATIGVRVPPSGLRYLWEQISPGSPVDMSER